jgi:hypothetical protein
VIRQNLGRDGLLLAGLVVLHELFRHFLAGEAIVSALFAPGGAHAAGTIVLGVLFVALRVVLLVGVPGWIGAQVVMVACARVTHTRSPPSTTSSQ